MARRHYSKFARLEDSLAHKKGVRNPRRLAGWITTHNPKVRARANATRARHRQR